MISRKYNALAVVMLSAVLAASCVAAPDNKKPEAESSADAASEVADAAARFADAAAAMENAGDDAQDEAKS